MIRCPHCEVENAEDSRFCSGCGRPLYVECASCGREVASWMAFCRHCGARIQAGEEHDHHEESGDSRVQLATVLFGDVKGFTAMSEHLPPEEVTEIMNECFEALSQAVVQYGGSVDKYVGDAIMARFGWPQAHEDDPVRSIHAGLEMQRALTKFAAALKAKRGFELAMRIGINTGQVFAARVGDPRFATFTLMGNTVNLASRLEHEAEPGSVLVGENTYRLARHAFEFKAMPPMEIRGQSELINAFVPLRPKTGAASSRAGRSERQLRLVGRDAELVLLDRYLAEARAGQGRIVAVVADPGLGKSRLIEEFWRRHLDQGVARVYAAAPSFGESMPYSLLSSLVRSLLFGEVTDHEITADEVRGRLTALLPEAAVADALALLDEVLGIEDGGETEVSHLEARSRQAMLTNMLKLILAARSQQGALLINLEDMHWVDSASMAVFEQIFTGIQNLPIMVLLTHRPRFTHPWSGSNLFREIKLLELPPENARDLLAEFFGSHAIPPAAGHEVIAKAGGNPFFLEQLLNNLIESGAVVQQGGQWVLAGDISSLTVPDSIQEILQARIDQLSRGARTVLETASVIGRIFVRRLLEAVLDDMRKLDESIQTLQRQEFIFEKSLLPEVEYMFTHALTQDVAYNGLPESKRKLLHERVASAIESLGITISNEQQALLAVHYEKTENREKALEYALAAAVRASRLYANQDAITHYQQALELLEQEPVDEGQMLPVLEALGDVYRLVGRLHQARESYERSGNLSVATPVDRSRLWRKMGDLAESQGNYAEALPAYREAERALADVDAPAEQVNVWLAIARMHRSRGVLESASETSRRALSLASKVDEATGASLYFELGEIERERGHLTSAAGYLAAASSVWEQMGALEKQALVASALADVAFNQGDLAEAMNKFNEALETQRRVFDRHGVATTLYGIGRIKVVMGQIDEAIACYTESMDIANEIESRSLAANCMLQLGTIFLERGEMERAEALIREADRAFKKMRNWRGSANALVARARLSRARGDPDHARRILERADNLAEEMDDPWIRAQVSVGQAELEEEAGRLNRGAEHALRGISMGRDLSDPRLVARGERVLGRIRARQGQMGEGLRLLAGSVESFRRSGAAVDAARAALDYVIVAQRMPGDGNAVQSMLQYAWTTLEQVGSARDLQIARSVAQRIGVAAGR